MSVLTMSGAVVPHRERLADFLKMSTEVAPEVEERLLAGLSTDQREDVQRRVQLILVDAGVEVSRVLREARPS